MTGEVIWKKVDREVVWDPGPIGGHKCLEKLMLWTNHRPGKYVTKIYHQTFTGFVNHCHCGYSMEEETWAEGHRPWTGGSGL